MSERPATQPSDPFYERDGVPHHPIVIDAADLRRCPHTVATNLRCGACGEFIGVPPSAPPDAPR